MRLLPGPAPGLMLNMKSAGWGTSLMVQWLLLHASAAGPQVQSSVRKPKYRKPHSMTKKKKIVGRVYHEVKCEVHLP